jgi:Ca2+/Na+ antiporter
MPRARLQALRLPNGWTRWLTETIAEEEQELEVAIHPDRGNARDAATAALATLTVVGASIAMEQAASTLGHRHGVPEIVVGGIVLAAVTSLPNAVAAVYLAQRGRGAATLSTALNSNALNVAIGLLLPATIVGLGSASSQSALIAVWYLAMTAFALGCAYAGRGLRAIHGALIIGGYVAFVVTLLATT